MPGVSAPEPMKISGYVAGADLTGYQYCLVKRSAANTVIICTADTDLAIGVLYNEPYTGEPAEIVPPGQVCMLRVDGNASAITAGMRLSCNSTGEGIYSVTNLKRQNAIALDDSSAANDEIAVFFAPCDISL